MRPAGIASDLLKDLAMTDNTTVLHAKVPDKEDIRT